MKKEDEAFFPAIKLKFLKSQKTYPPDEDPETFFFECAACSKRTNKLGAVKGPRRKHPEYVCESCAIDEYRKSYGFQSRAAAAARRRRIFDVPYLFQELYISEYLKRRKVRFAELGEGAFEQLFVLSREAYNAIFGPDLKKYLEELDQWELELIFRNFIVNTPPFIMDGIDPHSVRSPFKLGSDDVI